jgi:hypothetical protein
MTLKHVHEARSEIALRPAWRLQDPVIQRDAEIFWQKERLLPKDADVPERLSELCMAGYDGNALIALTTARIRHIGFLGVKLAMLRVAIDSDKRRNRLATIIQAESRELLEQWSLANPAEEVMGMGTVTQTHAFDERGWSRGYLRSSHLGFIGWTANGEHMRVAWFEHARIPVRRPDMPSSLRDEISP